MAKKTIVIAINDLCIGGAQRQLIRQLPYFNREKYDIHIITLFPCGERTDISGDAPDHIHLHRFSFRGFIDIVDWIRLYRLLKSIKPDLVMSSLFFSNTVLRVLSLFLKYPTISREHNTYIDKTRLQIMVDQFLARRTKRIVGVSKEVTDFTSKQQHIDREKFVVVNNGIDLTEIETKRQNIDRKEVRRELGVHDSDRILLNVSRLASQKNHELMIISFMRFHENHPHWKLVIVGGGEEETRLRDLVEVASAEAYIQLLGDKENVHPYYAVADAFITTSHIEGMSNVHLEALAHGIPILATKTGGTSSIIRDGKNGYFIHESTEEEVVEVLEQIEKEDLDRLKGSAREVSHEFAIEKTVAAYEQLFDAYAKTGDNESHI